MKEKVVGLVEAVLPIRHCCTLNEAVHALAQEQFALVVCGFQFDDSRMFELLKIVRAHPTMHGLPFIALRVPTQVLTEAALQLSSKAALLLGADYCIDLDTCDELDGEAQAQARFQQLIRDALAQRAVVAQA